LRLHAINLVHTLEKAAAKQRKTAAFQNIPAITIHFSSILRCTLLRKLAQAHLMRRVVFV
jgi:hypothetical protein